MSQNTKNRIVTETGNKITKEQHYNVRLQSQVAMPRVDAISHVRV